MKVSRKKQVRNYRLRDILKNAIKSVNDAVKSGDKAEAEKSLQAGYKVIDTAAKKNLIHKNNAARKKSGLAKRVAQIGVAKKVETKKKAAKKTVKAEAPAKKEVVETKETEEAK